MLDFITHSILYSVVLKQLLSLSVNRTVSRTSKASTQSASCPTGSTTGPTWDRWPRPPYTRASPGSSWRSPSWFQTDRWESQVWPFHKTFLTVNDTFVVLVKPYNYTYWPFSIKMSRLVCLSSVKWWLGSLFYYKEVMVRLFSFVI